MLEQKCIFNWCFQSTASGISSLGFIFSDLASYFYNYHFHRLHTEDDLILD